MQDKFQDPKALSIELHNIKFKRIGILDPRIKIKTTTKPMILDQRWTFGFKLPMGNLSLVHCYFGIFEKSCTNMRVFSLWWQINPSRVGLMESVWTLGASKQWTLKCFLVNF